MGIVAVLSGESLDLKMTGHANRPINRVNEPIRFFILSTNGPLKTGFSSLRTRDIFLILLPTSPSIGLISLSVLCGQASNDWSRAAKWTLLLIQHEKSKTGKKEPVVGCDFPHKIQDREA